MSSNKSGNNNVVWWFLVTVILVSWSSLVSAESDIRISGFLTTIVTQGKNDTDTPYANGMATKDLEWDTRDNHVGIQFASTINPKMDVAAQFISRGGDYNYNLETDWAYIDFKAFKNARFRVGKYKVPQFILSDYLDVGYAYPWVRPPQDVYGTNPLIALNGVDLLYKIDIYSSKLLFDLFVGDGTHNTTIPPRTVDYSQENFPPDQAFPDEMKGQQILFDTKNTRGAAIKFASQSFTMRAGYFKTDVDASVGPMELKDVPGAFGGVGFTMDVADIIAYAEFIRRNTDPQMELAFPDQDAWYVTLGYRFGKFLPTYTFSEIKPGLDKSDLAVEEKSQAVGFRYDIADSADIKFEALYVKPKEGNHGLFDDPVEKGTIYSASFDVIF